MEEKVQYMLKLIEEDGDSFAKRAEMYYKKRPELINFVEDSYRAFRALAERYDHLSTELQNANNTIASVFPEEVQYEIDDEDEYGSPKVPKSSSQVSAPNVPKAPSTDFKGLVRTATKKLQARKPPKTAKINNTVAKSGLSKSEALEEIDKLQKEILALQTVKEFVKSSYESRLAKYWGIDSRIMQMQQKVCSLQDEFGVGKVIEDNDARTLMAEAALKSCQETLAQLQEEQDRSSEEARAEHKRIENARERLKSLKHEFLHDRTDEEKPDDRYDTVKSGEKTQSSIPEVTGTKEERQEMAVVQEKIKEHFEAISQGPLTVSEMAEKIDELVNKVISLETAVSSQTALINKLRTEAHDLHSQIQSLEDDKASLIDDTFSNRLKEMEDKLHGIQNLNQNVENQNHHLKETFTEARCSLGHLSEKLQTVKPDEDLEIRGSLQEEKVSLVEIKPKEELEELKDTPSPCDGFGNSSTLTIDEGEDSKQPDICTFVKNQSREDKKADDGSNKCQNSKPQDKVDKQVSSQPADSPLNTKPQKEETEKEDGVNWQQMLLTGLEDREKVLLTEYTGILRSYKDAKKQLSEVEKRNRDNLFEMTVQLREMKSAIAKRDEEIQSLRWKLNLEQASVSEDKYSNGDHPPSTSDSIDDRSAKPEARIEDPSNNEDTQLTKEEEEHIMLILTDQPQCISVIEEKLRMNIDAILDENLEFWLRFSTAFHQIQKFKTEVQDLQDEIKQLKEKKKQEGSIETDLKSDLRPIYKHLREIQTELTLWLEQSELLKGELQRRSSSLCNIQEEITMALKEGMEEEEIKFTSHQAAKFQGEVLNMKQENNKVRVELQAGYDHVTALQQEIEKTLAKLDHEFGLSEAKNQNQPQLSHSTSRSRVPLRSFIFGNKPRKQKHSLFSSMHPNKKFQVLRSGIPM
ncbi:unnamed protein product [Ilex paraguariensis]|uniref:NAB domain-containing protein n=1 Tax=Ilex paraguariensis TaxID=185542 RepID=A0ABC8U367_9AQUA